MLGVLEAGKKFFCQCETVEGEEVFLSIRAYDEADASQRVHEGYRINFVLDILTPLQMEYRKRHLRPGMLQVQGLR